MIQATMRTVMPLAAILIALWSTPSHAHGAANEQGDLDAAGHHHCHDKDTGEALYHGHNETTGEAVFDRPPSDSHHFRRPYPSPECEEGHKHPHEQQENRRPSNPRGDSSSGDQPDSSDSGDGQVPDSNPEDQGSEDAVQIDDSTLRFSGPRGQKPHWCWIPRYSYNELVVLTLVPEVDDYDLCVWEPIDYDWKLDERYGVCHNVKDEGLIARSVHGYTDKEKVSLTHMSNRMACVVPWKDAAGPWTLTIEY